jgi:transcriptional regulator with XRE-family HTH domain
MNTRTLWAKLADKRYRQQFVSAQARRSFAFQLRAIMKKRGISQQELAKLSGLTQGVISRAADPNSGKLTTTVIVKIANGLDLAYLGNLVAFSEAANWFSKLSEESVQVPTFDDEDKALSESVSARGLAEAASQRNQNLGRKHPVGALEMGGSSEYGEAEKMGLYLMNNKAA